MCYHHSDDEAYTAHLQTVNSLLSMSNIPNDERVECVNDDDEAATNGSSDSDEQQSRMEEAMMNDEHNPISMSHKSNGLRYGGDFKDGEPYTQEDVDSDLTYLSMQQTAMTTTMMNLFDFVTGSLADMHKDIDHIKTAIERIEQSMKH